MAELELVRPRGTSLFNLASTKTAMKRVTGIGGIFFKSTDPKALGAGYKEHLGIDVQEWGGAAFDWKRAG